MIYLNIYYSLSFQLYKFISSIKDNFVRNSIISRFHITIIIEKKNNTKEKEGRLGQNPLNKSKT